MRAGTFRCGVALGFVLSIAGGAARVVGQQAGGSEPATIDMTVAKPESVGFSSERLERLHALMQEAVDAKQLPGAVTLLARHGKVVDYRTYGMRDAASGAAMTRDTIFRAFSMTKPVTGVAMMLLYEQGKWLPSDPIAKYIPEFAHLKVCKGVDGAGNMILEDPIHPPTMKELMTHTAGFVYGFFGNTPVDKEYQKTGVMQSKSLQEFIGKLAKIPLAYQPGTKWVYSVSMDIQGYIIEKLSGQMLPDFMRDHIFKPLGMKDSGFFVPADKRGRFVTIYRSNEKGEVVPAPGFGGDYAEQPTMASGGGGMVTTAEDYFRFAEMLANGGELNGVRILSLASVQLMSTNHLAANLLTGEFSIGAQVMRPGLGYGYDCAVEYDPGEANLPDGRGTFFWDGAAGTWFWIDPTNDIVFIGMVQRVLGPDSPQVEYQSRPAVYQALVNPKK
ncbi:MAG TPA: serine hydrolase domain-containing protein [Verrucomicrobiae bacterium]|jgi:CubicO group peptidase (beta-lactamase class C family)|nr:serine hydrolase domain-containing protein [Verrucomicrobiae bacterium]